ncbi:hypothetical protein P9112_012990 [Eukaryota sp. TZLM1-RC]
MQINVLYSSKVVIHNEEYCLAAFRGTSSMDALTESTVSLYHHVLPNITKSLVRNVLSRSNTVTFILFTQYDKETTNPNNNSSLSNSLHSILSLNDDSHFHLPADDLSTHSLSDVYDSSSSSSSEAESVSSEENQHCVQELKSLVCAAITLEYNVSSAGCSMWSIAHNQSINQLTLIGVRVSFQSLGLANYLMNFVLKPTSVVSGLFPFLTNHDVFLTYSDHDAVSFFKKFDFSTDLVLISPYSNIGDEWSDCILMVRFNQEKQTIDNCLKGWVDKKIQMYSHDLQIIEVLGNRIKSLEQLVAQKDDVIAQKDREIQRLLGNSVDLIEEMVFPYSSTIKLSDLGEFSFEFNRIGLSVVEAFKFDLTIHPNKDSIIKSLCTQSKPIMTWLLIESSKVKELWTRGSFEDVVGYLNISDVKFLDSEFLYCIRGYSILKNSVLNYSKGNHLKYFSPVLGVKLKKQ